MKCLGDCVNLSGRERQVELRPELGRHQSQWRGSAGKLKIEIKRKIHIKMKCLCDCVTVSY